MFLQRSFAALFLLLALAKTAALDTSPVAAFPMAAFPVAAPVASSPTRSPQKTEITVSAAASLKDALSQIGALYRRRYPDATLSFNFGASGALQKQIELGAPVDVFVSAADKNMNALAAQNLIETASRCVIARNRLVLIVPTSSARSSARSVVRSFRDLARDEVKNVAIGAPQSVPAGKYAQQVLANIGAWSKVLPKAVQCKDVRAVLTQVELGNVDAGIVYRSDAASSQRVRVVAVAPTTLHSPICYSAAVMRDAAHRENAWRFVVFLRGDTSQKVLRNMKFGAP